MSAFDAYVQAAFHGGTMDSGPCFTVIHDAETPLRAGYADSIAEFFRVGPKAGTSAHAMVDPAEAIKLLPDNVVAWAAGPYANPYGWHLEQAGYARFTRADWTTPDGLAQVRRVGACVREVHDAWGIPKRWMTDDQLRRAARGDRSSGGMTTHQQVARVLGGTTHTDPETNYPRDPLLEAVLDQAPEDDMFSDDDRKKLDGVAALLDWYFVPDDDPGTPYDERNPNSKGEFGKRIRGTHTMVAALAARDPQVTIDAEAIAAAIPDELAEQVAQKLADRLES